MYIRHAPCTAGFKFDLEACPSCSQVVDSLMGSDVSSAAWLAPKQVLRVRLMASCKLASKHHHIVTWVNLDLALELGFGVLSGPSRLRALPAAVSDIDISLVIPVRPGPSGSAVTGTVGVSGPLPRPLVVPTPPPMAPPLCQLSPRLLVTHWLADWSSYLSN